MERIVYFTAGIVPTTEEAAEIAALNEIAAAPYEVTTVNGQVAAKYGDAVGGGIRPIPCDYVAGTVPQTGPYASKPVFDPESAGGGFPVGSSVFIGAGPDGGPYQAIADGTLYVDENDDRYAVIDSSKTVVGDEYVGTFGGNIYTIRVTDGQISNITHAAV